MGKEHVRGVFDSIAGRYDAANDRISLGAHRLWKRRLVDCALAACMDASPGLVLDVCCGTGDITERIAHERPDVLVVGLDFSASMLAVAEKRLEGLNNTMLVEGNAMALPFDEGTFDACVISFGLRNTPDYEQVLSEMARVVRPGGAVACLDASVVDSDLVKPAYQLYYKYLMPILGGGFSHFDEYGWLYESTQEFLRKDELYRLFERTGLCYVDMQSFMFGAAALHVGYAPLVSKEA